MLGGNPGVLKRNIDQVYWLTRRQNFACYTCKNSTVEATREENSQSGVRISGARRQWNVQHPRLQGLDQMLMELLYSSRLLQQVRGFCGERGIENTDTRNLRK